MIIAGIGKSMAPSLGGTKDHGLPIFPQRKPLNGPKKSLHHVKVIFRIEGQGIFTSVEQTLFDFEELLLVSTYAIPLRLP